MNLKTSATGDWIMYLDRDTNRFVYVLEHKNELCPYYFHDTKISHQYAAYNVIKKDLDIVREAFSELDINRNQSPTIRLSLLFAGIIMYGKCYSEAKGRKVSLDAKTVLSQLDDQLAKIHEQLITLRNQYVAHAGEGEYEQYPVTISLYPDVNNKAIHGFMINGIHQVHHEPFLKDYILLVDKVLEHVSKQIGKIQVRLNEEVSRLDIEEIYRTSKTPVLDHSAPISGVVTTRKKGI